MAEPHLIEDAYRAANQPLERLAILTLLVAHEQVRSSLPESQVTELDHWMFDLVTEAQGRLKELHQLAKNFSIAQTFGVPASILPGMRTMNATRQARSDQENTDE